ncbi:MAG: YjbH domain-containing protein [Syntrophales bacterium]|jgi:hypothetical protein|nr:YjbH domain-containing protein [Syntrophales bacterium]
MPAGRRGGARSIVGPAVRKAGRPGGALSGRAAFRPLLILLVLFFTLPGGRTASAADAPFTGPANWGGTGLIETPSARILREGRFRVGAAQAHPYRYYYGAITVLPGLEIDGRISEIIDVPAPGLPDYGNYKDKAVDLKWQFLPEGKWRPAVALGLMDPHGTRLYASQYIVASKQIYPFDFTVGFGNGRYGSAPLPVAGEQFKMEMITDTSTWARDGHFFGGIQFEVSDWLMLTAEYSPIEYEKMTSDPAQSRYFQGPATSRLNWGMRLRPWEWLEFDLTYQRGNQVGFNVSVAFDLGKPMVPIYDHPYREKPDLRALSVEKRIARALNESGFSHIGIQRDGDHLWIEAANNKYFYHMKAVGVALRTVHGILAQAGRQEIRTVTLTVTQNGVPVVELATAAEDLDAFFGERFNVNEFLYVSEIRTDTWKTPDVPKEYWRYFDYVLKPDFKVFLNDPSGFVSYKLGVAANLLFTPWAGSTFAAGLLGYPVNTVSSSNAPSSTPVRTDIVPYQQQKVAMGLLLFSHIRKFEGGVYGRVAAGYLEEQYAGFDWEAAKPVRRGRFLLGLSGSVLKKRDSGSAFGLKENDWKDRYVTGFFNVRLNIPEAEMNIDLKNGQFLAGDRGTVVTVSRNFNGVVLSAWYSISDTSMFPDSYNAGYHNKGIAISIPLRLFTGQDSRTSYGTGVAPWTRDVAQDINHFDNLFDFIGRNVDVYTEKDKRNIQ